MRKMKPLRVVYLLSGVLSISSIGCGNDAFSGDVPPSVSGPALRVFSAPSVISAIPYRDPSWFFPTCINSNRARGLDVLVRVPLDTLYVPKDYGSLYLRYESGRWNPVHFFYGRGSFYPCTLRRDGSTVNILWNGVKEAEYADWVDRRVRATNVFHANCQGPDCGDPRPILPTQGSFLPELQSDEIGDISFVYMAPNTTEEVYTDISGNEWEGKQVGIQSSPRKLVVGNDEYLTYVSVSIEPRFISNVVFFHAREGSRGDWGRPEVLYQDEDKKTGGNFPTIAVDASGSVHVLFYRTDNDSGVWTLMHTQRKARGRWTEPDSLYSDRFIASMIPTLLADERGYLHAFWGHSTALSDGSPGTAAYYASWFDGAWAKPLPLFAEYDVSAPVLAALDDEDVLHLIFTAANQRSYHAIAR